MNPTNPTTLLPFLLAGLSLTGPLAAQSAIVLPPGYAQQEGNSQHEFPWGVALNPSQFGCRVQTIYDSAYFTSQGWNGPQVIQRMRWRADGVAYAVSTGGSYANVQIDMSTAAVDHGSASTIYANNHGGDRQTVVAGTVTMPPTPNQSPNVWFIDLVLAAPFVYDPSQGDLVVDVQLPSSWSGGTPGRPDAVSSLYSGSVGATTVFHRYSSTASVGEWKTNGLAFVIELEFPAAGQATVGTFGTGCGAGQALPLVLQPLNAPVLGTSLNVAVQNLPAGTVAGLFVLGTAQFPGGVSLGVIGAPGCQQYVDLAGSRTDAMQPLGAVALQSYPLPSNPTLAGMPLFVQAAGIVPGANAAGLLTSNGVDAVLGTF